MQEKKQKKIKASGMPANFGDFRRALVYPAYFPALGRGPFLALMQEKKQKKIKVPGAPAKLAGYMIDGLEALAKLAGYMIGEVQICAMYQANFPASAEVFGRVFTLLTVRSSGAYGRAGVWGG